MMRRYQETVRETEIETENYLFVGLDLGQAKDFSALAVIECIRTITGGDQDVITALNCIHLQRWQLRTPYPVIVADVVKMVNNLDPFLYPKDKTTLAIDATGCGAPVVDLFKREQIHAELKPIQIVGGANISEEFGMTRVPKRDLVSVVQVALQNRTLRIASGLPEAETLSRELQNFTVKITDSANDVYGAWREGTHDDLVLAVALALWCANRPPFRVSRREKELFAALAGNKY
ncbi:MAG: hypothetical protein WKF90_16325 [Pyrinomonadaceae bacterium]